MNIVVVADTHIPKRAKALPIKLIAALQTADLIIHAGDWQTLDVYHMLSKYANVAGVVGNVDEPGLHHYFQQTCMMELHGFKIGVVHGHGEKMTTEKRALAAFTHQNVDCIIFGHSHIPLKKYHENVLLFNPGSATDKRRQPQYSFGILTLGDMIEAQHIFYNDKHE